MYKKIIEKAERLGISVDSYDNDTEKLHAIAEQLGFSDFDIEDTGRLEAILDEQLQEGINDNIDVLEDDNEALVNEENSSRFGEEAYNEATNEHGVYDNKYYAKKGEELDKKVEDARKEKDKTHKDNPKSKDGEAPRQIKKTKLDQAKDNANLLRAKNERAQNKIRSAQAKAFQVMHPGEALKSQAKSAASDAAKAASKKAGAAAAKAGKAVGKLALTGAKALISFIIANPVVLVIIGIIVLIVFVILMLGGSTESGNYVGLYGYDYFESACPEVMIDGNLISIEEYVQGVTAAEVFGFPPETVKAFAIAARTYIVQSGAMVNNGDSCYYDATGVKQAYNKDRITDEHIEAANDTRGIIITLNGLVNTYYDASCVYTAEQALGIDPSGSYSSDYYYLRYGSDTIGGINFQPVEIGKIADIESLNYYVNKAISEGACAENHGMGMSQNGAAYLETYDNYTWQDIINYYYQNQAVLMSIYKSYEISNNWLEEISTKPTSTISTTILSTPLNELLQKTEYDQLNELIYDSVVSNGIGTREAIVSAAVTPIKYLAENYNVVIPYTLGGGHYMTINSYVTGRDLQKTTTDFYGLDPDWGTRISHSYNGNYYDKYGPDCSSFVPWVYKNAGIFMGARTAGSFVNLGSKYEMGGEYIAKPGDLLENSGHITVVVGVDNENETYYIAHASGGSSGTIITPVSFYSNSYYIVDMSYYIENSKVETYEEDFRNGVLVYE